MNNLTMTKKSNDVYWEEFYKEAGFQKESDFCNLVKDLMDFNTIVFDVGCGLGRDSFSFARDGYLVVGIDKSEEAIKKNLLGKKQMQEKVDIDFRVVDLSNMEILTQISKEIVNIAHSENKKVLVYLRFLLHSVEEKTQKIILKTFSDNLPIGSQLAAEFRTIEDKSRSKIYGGHFRRFIDAEGLVKDLEENYSFKKVLFEKGTGLSVFKEEDPFIGRIIVEKIANN